MTTEFATTRVPHVPARGDQAGDGGNTVGIVTATDAFEAITGEMEDSLDDEA